MYENVPDCSIPHTNYQQSLEELEWFHPGLSRNTAEALLLSNSEEGTYLLRESKNRGVGYYAVSARCQNSVKHFELEHNKSDDSYVFGVYTFYSCKELIEHFYQQPVLGNDSAIPVVLRYPYPNEVYEPRQYSDVTKHSERQEGGEGGEISPDFHVGSKEGYLVKRGDFIKTWKKRWFVIQKDKLMYYTDRKAKKPKKVWDLNTLLEVKEAGVDDKKHCFCLVFTNRTIFCLASSPLEVNEWIEFFQWKINHFKKMKES